MNAILGVDRLPTGLLPHTSVITTVTYGDREKVLIRLQGWSLPQEIPLSQLVEYVTENGNPGNRRSVSSAEIQLPVELLRRGLLFVDTPGVGSAIIANTTTTRHFLPEADSAIFVTSFDSPLGDGEIEFLREVHRTVGKVFFVVNKLDLVSAHEKDDVLRYVRQRLSIELGADGFELFAVSARDALRGKLDNDSDALQRSGLCELEDALVRFLRIEKTRQLCRRVLDRLIHLVERQRVEATLLGSHKDSRPRVLQIQSRIEAIHARRRELVTGIRAVTKTVPSRLSPDLDAIFTDVAASAVSKFAPNLCDTGALFEASHTSKVLRRVSSFVANELTQRVGACSVLIEWEVERFGGFQLDALKQLAAQSWSQLVQLENAAEQGVEPSSEELEPLHCAATVNPLPELKWKRRLPWRIYFTPLQWMGAGISDWFEKTISELMAAYRAESQNLIALAAEDYVTQIDREIEKGIDTCGARLTSFLAAENKGAGKENLLDTLITRAMGLRNALTTPQGYSLDCAQADGEAPQAAEFAVPGCPVCDTISQAIFDFLSKRQYDLSADEDTRVEHARSGGFCAMHTWMYATLTSPHGVCRAYPELLTAQGRQLRRAAMSSDSPSALEKRVLSLQPSESKCVVCDLVRRTEIGSVAELFSRQLLAQEEPGHRNPALCLPHLGIALKTTTSIYAARALALSSAASLERAADTMKRFALKFDALRQDLTTNEERQAYVTGLAKLVGDRRVTTNWVPEGRI